MIWCPTNRVEKWEWVSAVGFNSISLLGLEITSGCRAYLSFKLTFRECKSFTGILMRYGVISRRPSFPRMTPASERPPYDLPPRRLSDPSNLPPPLRRYSTRPQEMVVECSDLSEPTCLHLRLAAVAQRCLQFLTTHRYQPLEIYGESYEEFLVNVPDPIQEPKQIISDFLYILETLGQWSDVGVHSCS